MRHRGSRCNLSICGTDPIEAAVSSAMLSTACGRVIVVLLTDVGLVPFTYYRRAAEPVDRDGGAVLQNPGELVACDLCAAPSQVLQVRGADPSRHDPYKFPVTLRLVDLDDLNRGR